MKWYALYTRSRSEKKVAERLRDEGLEVYYPLVKELRIWSDRKKWILRPVLPSYIFVKIKKEDYQTVRQVPGVVNFVYWLGEPAVIRENEIERLKRFIEIFPGARSEEELPFEVGDEVKLEYGPLKGVSGIILNKNKNKARINIEALGLHIIASVNLEDLKLKHDN